MRTGRAGQSCATAGRLTVVASANAAASGRAAAAPPTVAMNSHLSIWIAMGPSGGGHPRAMEERYHALIARSAARMRSASPMSLKVKNGGDDRDRAASHVRFPKSGHGSARRRMSALCQKRTHAAQQNTSLFDHLVGAADHRQRDSEPSALAVFMLMINSTRVACCTDSWAGFSPLRIRPV